MLPTYQEDHNCQLYQLYGPIHLNSAAISPSKTASNPRDGQLSAAQQLDTFIISNQYVNHIT